MPKIIPIKELKDTAKLSNMVHEVAEPIYITKNGYDDMVIMSSDVYDRRLFLSDLYEKLDEAENAVANGEVKDFSLVMENLRNRYGL
ncbi:MAG: type II toxin-antitoxin system Phd/YefM family antitoxin [Clostridiales Family XIII bacterium]|jgi:PHD/YefM family antitoxin component YafN of YafNO toxin-antitoxin module|nr:type II toxin-antitoxin system Phd/YefM family antitoxin [Clostridiales Family XIII bacterium]